MLNPILVKNMYKIMALILEVIIDNVNNVDCTFFPFATYTIITYSPPINAIFAEIEAIETRKPNCPYSVSPKIAAKYIQNTEVIAEAKNVEVNKDDKFFTVVDDLISFHFIMYSI